MIILQSRCLFTCACLVRPRSLTWTLTRCALLCFALTTLVWNGGRYRRRSATLQSPAATLILLFPAYSRMGVNFLVCEIEENHKTCTSHGNQTKDPPNKRRTHFIRQSTLLYHFQLQETWQTTQQQNTILHFTSIYILTPCNYGSWPTNSVTQTN